MDERLVGAPHAVAAGEHVALEEALALMLGELLDDLALGGQQLVVVGVGVVAALPLLLGVLVGVLQAVGGRLVGAEDAEVVRVGVEHVGRVGAEDAGGLGGAPAVALLGHRHLVGVDVGEVELLAHDAAVGVGVGTQAQLAPGHEARDLGADGALLVEELLGCVGAQPPAEHPEVLVGVLGAGQRHLVGTPAALGLLAVDVLGAGPALGGAEDDHRVDRAGLVAGLGLGLDVADLVEDLLEQGREARVDGRVGLAVEAGHEEVRLVAHALEEHLELLVGDAGEDGGVGDLVAVEVQDRQHDAVGLGVHELVGLPGGGERARLGLAVAHHGHGQQARVVHHGAVGVGERVAELATLVDGAGGLGRVVAGDAAGVGELAEELLEAGLVIGDVRADLAVGAVEQRLRGAGRSAVARTHEEHRVLAVVGDEAVGVREQEVHARGGAPVAHEAVLDVGAAEVAGLAGLLVRPVLAHEGVRTEVDLADGQVVGRAPVLVDTLELLLGDGAVELLPGRADDGLCHVPLLLPGGWGRAERVRLPDFRWGAYQGKTFYPQRMSICLQNRDEVCRRTVGFWRRAAMGAGGLRGGSRASGAGATRPWRSVGLPTPPTRGRCPSPRASGQAPPRRAHLARPSPSRQCAGTGARVPHRKARPRSARWR